MLLCHFFIFLVLYHCSSCYWCSAHKTLVLTISDMPGQIQTDSVQSLCLMEPAPAAWVPGQKGQGISSPWHLPSTSDWLELCNMHLSPAPSLRKQNSEVQNLLLFPEFSGRIRHQLLTVINCPVTCFLLDSFPFSHFSTIQLEFPGISSPQNCCTQMFPI